MDFTLVLYYLFLAVLIIQLFYWLGFSRLLFFKSKEGVNSLEPVSIVVPAWNENENLHQIIPLLLDQDHPDFEVVIIDDRSVDDTYDYLIELQSREKRIQVVRVDEVPDHMNAKKYAVTLGIKAAKHDIILLTDADCRPRSPSWARSMVTSHTKNSVFVLGYSPYFTKWSVLNLLIRYETILTGIHYLSACIWGNPYMGVGRNLSYRKSFFLEKKGFHGFQHTAGGDDDLFINKYANRQNCNIAISPPSIVDSIPEGDWKSYLIQKRRHFSVGKHYKTRDKIRLSLFSATQILFWICFVTLSVLVINPYVVIGGFGLRSALQLVVIGFGAKKLSGTFPVVLLPFVDLFYSVFLPVVSIPALISKRIQWR